MTFALGGPDVVGWPWALIDVQAAYIRYVLERTRTTQQAASVLGISIGALYKRMQFYGLSKTYARGTTKQRRQRRRNAAVARKRLRRVA